MKTESALALKSIKEAPVVREVDHALNVLGIYHWRNQTGALKPAKSSRPIHYGKPGSSDFLGIADDGRFLAIECKRPVGGEKQRVATVNGHRIGFIEKVEHEHGRVWYLWDSRYPVSRYRPNHETPKEAMNAVEETFRKWLSEVIKVV